MLIRRLSINNVGNNRNYEYTLWSTAELIMLISLTLAALLTSIWLCCCCKKSKSKSARRQSRYQQEDEGERVSQHQRHHLQSSRHQHQQYRSRNHHHQRQLGDQERAGAVTANGNLDKQERPMVKQTSEVQQSREKPTSKLAQEVISLPSTDLAVPKNR
uniref:Uncharacterized protein n=1 Tax=Romanomermis culicivorax TaxID=13658 RepID=A0A915I9R2_ROMCU